jgi:hypothetical protein
MSQYPAICPVCRKPTRSSRKHLVNCATKHGAEYLQRTEFQERTQMDHIPRALAYFETIFQSDFVLNFFLHSPKDFYRILRYSRWLVSFANADPHLGSNQPLRRFWYARPRQPYVIMIMEALNQANMQSFWSDDLHWLFVERPVFPVKLTELAKFPELHWGIRQTRTN